ncbi:MAG: tail length tape measure protein, partial [Paraprevotella sp.]|nr:tail length tape measure protein [Paraprevotella sp.]
AAYNGGAGHVRDAMALARKNGKNPHSWQDVAPYILQLSKPEYYNDPDVQYGYLRGEETYNYVQSIIKRWETYRKVIPGVNTITPQPAKRSSAKKNNKG